MRYRTPFQSAGQKEADAVPSHSEAYFKAIIDTALDAIITIDISGRIETFNRAAERLFGYAPGEVLGRKVTMLMTGGDAAHHDRYIQKYLESGGAGITGAAREVTGRRKDGTTVPIHISIAEINVPERRVFAAILRDLSAQKATQAALQREQERLTAIVEQAPMGIVILRLDGPVIRVNRAFSRMTGYSARELKSMDIAELTHPDDRAASEAMFAKAKSGRITRYTERKRYLKKDGSILRVQVASAITHDFEGRPELLIGEVEDLTPRLNAEAEAREHRERLAHAERLNTLGEMASGIAHEINQPLTAISLFAQAGKRLYDQGKHQRSREMFDKLSKHAQQAGAVIEHVQALAHHRDSARHVTSLQSLTRDAVQLAEAEAHIYDITIRVEMEPGLPDINVDAVQMQQVTLNLLRNGMQAMRAIDCRHGSSIVLQVRRLEEAVQVSVIDSGCGVADEMEKVLFTPFKTSKKSGMGMGLSISKAIVKAHGGQLDFFNNESHGATFYFTLPAYREGQINA